MHEFDCIVIGGGIVGLATARTILERKPDVRIAVIEKEDGWARHQTGRNSGVIHSCIYYIPGSLKAKLCCEGNRRMVEFCQHHGIRYEVCGKVIVATKPSEIPSMERLFERGVANGLAVRRLTAPQVLEREPHVRCLAGIQVPSTGIVD
jgi:L-2-hydroxyglutarate oxidase